MAHARNFRDGLDRVIGVKQECRRRGHLLRSMSRWRALPISSKTRHARHAANRGRNNVLRPVRLAARAPAGSSENNVAALLPDCVAWLKPASPGAHGAAAAAFLLAALLDVSGDATWHAVMCIIVALMLACARISTSRSDQ